LRVMPAAGRRSAFGAVTGLISRNRLFAVTLAIAALIRLDIELGYRWQSWFNDSWDYVDTAVTLRLGTTRTSGYSLYMYLLRPFHSFALITVSQHLMGLAVAVMIYGLARRRFSCPAWLATAMTLPVLFDGYELMIEHMIMSDTLFLFLVMLAVTILLWWPLRPPAGAGPVPWWRSLWARCGAAGVLLSLSALVRADGEALLVITGIWLLLALGLCRVGWRKFAAAAAAFAVTGLAPLAAYMGWYDIQHGQFATSTSGGIFPYSRVMAFAECSKMGKLPVDLLALCTTTPPSQRPISQNYVWDLTTPLNRFPAPKFSALPNSLALQFAIRAVEAQPLAYAKVVLKDTWRAFYWPHTADPNQQTADMYLFGYQSVPIASGHAAGGYPSSAQAYLAGANPATQVVNPFAGAIRIYQRYVWLPGTIYGLILLAGGIGVIFAWRARGRDDGLAVLLPWITSLALIVIPAALADFDYRYVTTATPFACMAVAMAYGRAAAGQARPGRRLPFGGRASRSVLAAAGAAPDAGAGASAEAGGAPGLAGRLAGGGPDGSPADAGDD
jgi:hypothetical protein